MYAPYVQYVDPHIRGALPESFSFAIFALALWAMDRLRRKPGLGAWAASVLLVAAVILTHNLMALLFYGLLASWVVWQIGTHWWRQRGTAPSSAVSTGWLTASGTRLVAALVLGLGVAAFFWLPVILERNAVNLTTLIGAGDNYDFRTHFLSIWEMLSFSRRPDWGATQSPFLFNLGVAQWTGGLLAIALMVLGRVRHRTHLIYFALATVVILILMLPISEPLWAALPFMAYFQFPWRLLGAAAVLLAVLGGAGYGALALQENLGGRMRTWLPAVGVALPMLLALPLSQPTPWQPFGEVNMLRMTLIENSGRWLGTTSTADYVPATVEMLPERKESVVANFSLGLPLDRLNRVATPEGTTINTEIVRPLLTRYQIDAPEAFLLRLYQFDFPGWRVTLDGQPTATELAKPEGFIAVPVPEGQHIVEVRFGTTPDRTAAWLISALSILTAVAYGWALMRRKEGAAAELQLSEMAWRNSSMWPATSVAGAITLGFIILQPLGLFHYESSGLTLDRPAVQTNVNFGDQIALIGFDPLIETARPGDELTLSLFWKALRPLDIDYQSFVHIYDESGALVTQADKLNPGEYPTRRWPQDKYVPDKYSLTLPPELSPGTYRIAVGLWVQSEGWRLPVFDESGQQIGDTASLFEFEVK